VWENGIFDRCPDGVDRTFDAGRDGFTLALDDWVANVRPRAQAIRDALGLPPVPPGDLQL
jgi:hypothetical protein